MRTLKQLFYKSHILKVLPEPDIIDTLSEFYITEEGTGDMDTWSGLAIVNTTDIIVTSDGAVKFRENPKKIEIYSHNETTYKILKEIYSNGVIVQLHLKNINEKIILDMRDYNSVKNTFEIAKKAGISIKSDNELLEYAKDIMNPRIRFVKTKRNLGEKAFEGSKVSKYKLDCIICYDTDFILEIKKI